jgi:hypothetical protein
MYLFCMFSIIHSKTSPLTTAEYNSAGWDYAVYFAVATT